jgi:GNAT superfamily N-acetyltransferase
MKHHREPGDPTIEDKGVVISNITPRWVHARIEDNHQLIKCIQGEKLLGVSFFNAPESCPKHLRELNERFPKTRNATLTLMLVAPEAQGQGVFHLLMNATLTALQATGADLLIGEVEHTNERAKSAYAKFNGVIHPDISSPHKAPNGEMTAFLGLSIPIVPDAR